MSYIKNAIISSKDILKQIIKSGDIAIDATAGNGNDTLLMAELIGENGKLYCFDIQKEALQLTQGKLIKNNLQGRTVLINDGHENILKHIKNKINVVVFNLGYLPGGNHKIYTTPETTIMAIESSMKILKKGGIILIIIYHGGDTGFYERDELLKYFKLIDQKKYIVSRRDYLNWQNNPPFLVLIEKI